MARIDISVYWTDDFTAHRPHNNQEILQLSIYDTDGYHEVAIEFKTDSAFQKFKKLINDIQPG